MIRDALAAFRRMIDPETPTREVLRLFGWAAAHPLALIAGMAIVWFMP